MNHYEVTWTPDGNNRKGEVTFLTPDGHVAGTVSLYGVYENPMVSVIGAEHDGTNIYESAWAGGIDGAKGELVEKAVAFFEGYSMTDYSPPTLHAL